MARNLERSRWFLVLAAAAWIAAAETARAVDGVIEISQARVATGGVTPADTPGFPVQISASGSFRLTSDLTVPSASTTAIELTSAGIFVQLDMNGFSIVGPGSCNGCPATSCTAGGGRGIHSPLNAELSIRNGAIRGMGASGIQSAGIAVVEHLVIQGNGGRAIDALGGRVLDSRLVSNGDDGVRTFQATHVSSTEASCNGGGGIELGSGSRVIGNNVDSNSQTGIFANGGSTIADNSASDNNGAGISAAGGCQVLRNTASGNTAQGIFAVDGSHLQGNVVNNNLLAGITHTGPAGSLWGNVLSGNGSAVSDGKALTLGANVGYSNNVLSNHGPAPWCDAVNGGVEMLQNMCDGMVSCVMPFCPAFTPICGHCIP